MGTHTLKKKCPRCNKKRKYTCPYDHLLIGNWKKRDNKWICPWCIARETPDGEFLMRLERKKYLQEKHN